MKTLKRLRFWNRARRFRATREKPECDFALACIQPGQTAIDIGAHKAAFTYWMWRAVGRTGFVWAFEPQSALAAICQRFADTVQNVAVEQMALSDQKGTGVLKIAKDDLSCGSLVEPEGPGEVTLEEVPKIALDDFLLDHDAKRPVSFIKCDVEGHELEALKGCGNILSQDRPVVMLESFDRDNPAFEFLEGLGFVGHCFHGDQLEELNAVPGNATVRHNFVFLHPARIRLIDNSFPYQVEWFAVGRSQLKIPTNG